MIFLFFVFDYLYMVNVLCLVECVVYIICFNLMVGCVIVYGECVVG